MKRIASLLILLILVASFFVGYKSSKMTKELVIDVSTLPSSNILLASYLENSAAFEYSSAVEMLFLENGTIRANETLILETVGNASTAKVAISYLYPLIKIRTLKLKNAELVNASISQGKDIIYLAFEPKKDKVEITLEYELNWRDIPSSGLGSFGLLINQSIKNKEEVLLAPMYFPSVAIRGTKRGNTLVIKLPKEWWAFVVDSSSYTSWKLVDSKLSGKQRILHFEQKNPNFPLIFIGKFSRFTRTVRLHEKRVNITIYMPINESTKGNVTLLQVGSIVRTFSQWYGIYPYGYLDIVVSRLAKPHTGLNIGKGVLIVSGRGFDVWLLSHEISHSWFGSYADLGKISESLATFSAMAYALTHSEDVPSNFWIYLKISA
ncbi:M1 aminopeptidase family protein [Thermococcus barophilus]|uniref:hypothetical protein n=1 Tax=Thermococcus barophilus TaxID=55802 RepID=UPI000704812E|nr:hypothetical protein [Thermococcus barophilus]